jgi:hypothetical protein
VAESFGTLIAARALQGVFAALLAPTALSLLAAAFQDSPDRPRALGIFGAIAAAGASLGLLLGGVVTELLNWRWCLFVNFFFAVPTALAALRLIRNVRPTTRPRIDFPGVLLASAGLLSLVYGLSNAETHSWSAPTTIVALVASAVLLSAFLVVESLVPNPGRRGEEPISDRLVSLFDPDARPIRKGKLGRPTEFGYVAQIAEVTPNTKPGARGFILPPATAPGNPGENQLLPQTVSELQRLGLSPQEIAVDGGFQINPTTETLAPLAPKRIHIIGLSTPGSRRTQRRLTRYRVGTEGRISHLKRQHGLRRARLKGSDGHQTWTGWATFTYNLQTYGRYA